MKTTRLIFSLSVIAVICMLACRKEAAKQTAATDSNGDATGILATVNVVASPCDQFAYPDTIFYPSSLPQHYIVKPVTAQAGAYGAFPAGLAINLLNGNIDITKSETGLEYMVWFIPQGTTDSCIKYITVSGVNYNDSIYVMANGATATPIYNAKTLLPVDCSGGCEFDDGPDDDNGNGIADEPSAGQELIPKGFVINKATGVIDFKKSIQNGVLGKNPKNGISKIFTLNYRIGDKSSKALNRISFELFYYKTQAQIPAKLKEDVTNKQSQVLLEGEEENEGGHHSGHGGSSSFSSGSVTDKNGQGEVKCRPPYIIVTQQ